MTMQTIFHVGAISAAVLFVLAGAFAAWACIPPMRHGYNRAVKPEHIAGAAAVLAVSLVAAGFVLWGGFELAATVRL